MKLISRMLKKQLLKPLVLALGFVALCSHNLYIKMDSYFLKPNQQAILNLYNGSFEMSENIIARDRILDASVIAQGKRLVIDSSAWKDQDSTITQLPFNTGAPGTYVVGVSTKVRNIELSAEKFNSYLKSDGVLDILKQRTADNQLEEDAVERYEKHVKAIYQVGDLKTGDWKTVLGYPIEFVPQTNPYDSHTGDSIEFQLLLEGKPLPNQLVYADYVASGHEHEHEHNGETHSHEHGHSDGAHDHKHDEAKEAHSHDEAAGTHSHKHKHGDEVHKHRHGNAHSHEHEHEGKKHSHEHKHGNDKHKHTHGNAHSHEHEHEGKKHSHGHAHGDGNHDHNHDSTKEEGHSHPAGQQLRTNTKGIISVNLPEDGIYYLRTIHMSRVTEQNGLTHESKWATLSFEVTHKHDSTTHTHMDHEHEGEIPTWWFVLGSILFIGILFFIFRKKN